jgi:gas vesicle protein
MLSHDSQGFLTGEVIADIRRLADTMTAIRRDIAAIKNAVNRASNQARTDNAPPPNLNGQSSRSESNSDAGPEPATPPLRGRRRRALPPQGAAEPPPSGGGAQSQTGSGSNTLPPGNETAEPSPRRRRLSRSPVPHERDAQGRFTNNQQNSGGGGTQNPDEDEKKQKRLFDGLGDRLADAVTDSASSLEDVDPTIKAFREVAQPLSRGYQLLAGGDKETRWYRRIWRELKLFRGDQTVFNRAEQRVLNEISENTENQGGSGSGGGFLGGLIGFLPLLMKGLLKKVPLLGAILGGLGAAFDINATEGDDSLSRRQKDERNGRSIGGVAGSIGGMLSGAKLGALAGSFLGPIGTAVGSVVGGAAGLFFGDQAGQVLGEVTGFWVSELREADIPGKIVGAWSSLTDSFKTGWEDIKTRITEKWEEGVKFFMDLWEPIAKFLEDKFGVAKEAVNQANAYVKDKTGVDVKAGVTIAAQKAAEVASSAIENGKEAVSKAADWVGNHSTAGKVSKKLSKGWQDAKQYLLDGALKAGVDPGLVAKIAGFESGFNAEARPIRKRDGKVLSSAHGYGQFLDATWTEMVNKYGAKYGVENAGNLSKAEAAKLRSDKTLQASLLAEFTRENIEKGRALGGANDDANVYALHNLGAGDGKKFLNALRNNPGAKVGDILGQNVIMGNKSLYGDGSITLAQAYQNMASSMARGEVFANEIRAFQAPMAPVIALPPAPPSIPPLQAAPTVSDAPTQQITPYPVESARKNLNVSIDRGDVGRDLSERRLAHIVTGGLSN